MTGFPMNMALAQHDGLRRYQLCTLTADNEAQTLGAIITTHRHCAEQSPKTNVMASEMKDTLCHTAKPAAFLLGGCDFRAKGFCPSVPHSPLLTMHTLGPCPTIMAHTAHFPRNSPMCLCGLTPVAFQQHLHQACK